MIASDEDRALEAARDLTARNFLPGHNQVGLTSPATDASGAHPVTQLRPRRVLLADQDQVPTLMAYLEWAVYLGYMAGAKAGYEAGVEDMA